MGRSRNRSRRMIALMFAVVPTLFLAPQPAHAADVGGLAFEGTADVPTFPCVTGTACLASFNGTVAGQLAGEQFGPWEATIAAATISGTGIRYQDGNCVTGTATGHLTVTAGLGQVTGQYKPNSPGPLPLPITGLTIDVDFNWTRVGGTAAVVFANGVVRATIPGQPVMVVMNGALGGSAAAFAATIDVDDPPDCNPANIPPTNTPAITAEVVGAFTLVDPSPNV